MLSAPVSPTISHVFRDLFTQIDTLLATFVNGASAKVITAITPIITVCFMIWLLWHAYNVMMGHAQMPIADLIKKCLVWSIIMSLALTAGNYQSGIGNVLRTLPNDAAAAFLPSVQSGDQLGGVLDKTAGIGIDKAKAFWNQPTGTFQILASVVLCCAGVGILLSTLILCVVGFFMLALATVTISFLAALGPLFIACAAFDSTRQYFWSWVSHSLYWVMFMVLFAFIVTFVNSTYQFYANSVVVGATGYSWVSTLFACNVVAVFGMLFFFQIPKVAAGLTGGSGHTTLGAVGGLVRTVVSTVAAVKTVGAAKALAATGAASGGAVGGAAGQAAQGAAQVAANQNNPPRNYNRGQRAS